MKIVPKDALMILFTGVLAFTSYQQERAYVVPARTQIVDFKPGATPVVRVFLKTIGPSSASHVRDGWVAVILPHPLGPLALLAGPANSAPMELFSNMEDRLSLTLPTLSSDDYAAVSDGKTRLLYVWGTIEYRDFLWIPHNTDFCWAFGGTDMNSGGGICPFEHAARYAVIDERRPEPHAQPNAAPQPVLPSP
jgi:hypothetical protein